MRTVSARKISDTVARLCIKANLELRPDVLTALKNAYRHETRQRPAAILKAIIENAAAAKDRALAICQDTGMPCVYVDMGQDARVRGDINKAVSQGIAQGYRAAYLRNSIVQDPLRRGSPGFAPGILHIEMTSGSGIRITVLPKGFGCENKSRLHMFNPTAKAGDIKQFVIDAVRAAGPDACPPYVVGVGIGGTAEYACLLAKKAVLKKIDARRSSSLEKELLRSVNKLNIGPMGLGGRTTALAVHVMTYPTHIAGLPVAVNISCHATRSAAAKI